MVIEQVSQGKVLSVLANSDHQIKPRQQHYNTLEVYEFWTYVGNKKNEVQLIYAYDRHTKDCCLCVGQEKPYYYQAVKTRLMQLGISFDKIACFTRRAFKKICCFSKKL